MNLRVNAILVVAGISIAVAWASASVVKDAEPFHVVDFRQDDPRYLTMELDRPASISRIVWYERVPE